MNDMMGKHPTSNIQLRQVASQPPEKRQISNDCGAFGLNFGTWDFSGAWCLVLGAFLLLQGIQASAQAPAPQPDPLMQLMLTQPSIDISTNVEIRAVFDPPVIGVGQKSAYRVTINAVSDSIKWPDDIYAPMELTLKQSARGQILQPALDKLRPMTTINHHVTAAKPGAFTIPEFKVKVYGRNITVPAARLQVLPETNPAVPVLRLFLELAETNAFCGQPVRVRVLMPAAIGNAIQALNQVQINGDGILVDQTSVRQRIQAMEFNGRTGPVYVYESFITPLVAGRIELAAQAFTAGNQFSGAITIQGQATIVGGQPQYVLLDSDVTPLNVEPLPRAGLLPGFSGAIGQFEIEPSQLATNRVRVGDAVKLLVTFRASGESKRINPPTPPAVTNWQIFPAVAEGGPTLMATAAGLFTLMQYSYTLIPLTNDMKATPAIPFSYFDPAQKKYVDLTIPALPIEVMAGLATAEAQAFAQAAAATTNDTKLKLSGLAAQPGATASSLVPLQLRRGFWVGQLVPLLGFAGLWFWDRRRRFYELHPEVLVRKRARRALRRERRALQQAARDGDAARFANRAVSALRVAGAPHFPATPRALVGRDILELFGEPERAGRSGEVVRKIFAVTDAAQFSPATKELSEVLTLQPELEQILDQLEAKLR